MYLCLGSVDFISYVFLYMYQHLEREHDKSPPPPQKKKKKKKNYLPVLPAKTQIRLGGLG